MILRWLLPILSLYYKHITIVNDADSVISKWLSKLWHHLQSQVMTLAKSKVKVIAKAKHIYSTGITYDCQNIFIVQATGLCQTGNGITTPCHCAEYYWTLCLYAECCYAECRVTIKFLWTYNSRHICEKREKWNIFV